MKKHTTEILLIIAIMLALSVVFMSASYARTLITSPGGSDINKLVQQSNAGDTIILNPGLYRFDDMQYIHDRSNLTIIGYGAILSPSVKYDSFKGTQYHYAGIFIQNCSGIIVQGLEITGYSDVSASINTWSIWGQNLTNCKFERLNVHHNSQGIFLNGTIDNCTLLNCDSWCNSDILHNYENADGIGLHSTLPESHNWILGCRTWWNADDGVDCLGNEGYIDSRNTWSWNNGYQPNSTKPAGNGQGFKLGSTVGDYRGDVKRYLSQCFAFHNRSCGFDQNYAKCGMWFGNCTAVQNGVRGFNLNCYHGEIQMQHNPTGDNYKITHYVYDCVSYYNFGVESTGLFNQYSDIYGCNFQYSGYSGYDYGTGKDRIKLSSSDFKSTSGTLARQRKANGDLPAVDLYRIKNTVYINMGY